MRWVITPQLHHPPAVRNLITLLAQVPNFVAQKWNAVCAKAMNEDFEAVGPELGTIRWTPNATDTTGGAAKFELTLSSECAAGREGPLRAAARRAPLPGRTSGGSTHPPCAPPPADPQTASLPQDYRMNVTTQNMASMLAFSDNAGAMGE